MTKDQFIAAVEAKPNFIKWAKDPALQSTVGDIEHWLGKAYIRTDDGRNLFDVWFFNDTATNEAHWQNVDTMEPQGNASAKKQATLEAYLSSNFAAYFVEAIDLDNNWARATVYAVSGQDLAESKVLVFKRGANPITHRNII